MPAAGEEARRARRLALAGIAVAAIAALGVGAVTYLWRTDAAVMAQKVKELDDKDRERASDRIGREVRAKLQAASYVVVFRDANGREQAIGTAAPISPTVLATNAHIVDEQEKLKPGERLLVRSPGEAGKAYEVTGSQKHPGYDAFQRFIDQDPFFVESSSAWLRASISYDVGTLQVAEGANLGPILEIATAEELQRLEPGTPLAMAGYPLRDIPGREVKAIGAIPTLTIGIVTALSDMFNLPAGPAYRRLVQHNLPGTGGNSGSPMLNAAGRLVARENAGTYVKTESGGVTPNAAMVRYAQRADFLLDVLSGRAEKAMADERAYWEKQTAAFKRGIDVLVPLILAERRPGESAKPVLVSKSDHTITAQERFVAPDYSGKTTARRQKIHQVSLTKGRPATFIAYAQNRAKIKLYLVINQTPAEKNERDTWFPNVQYLPQADGKADVYVVGADEDVTYTLLEYAWDVPRS